MFTFRARSPRRFISLAVLALQVLQALLGSSVAASASASASELASVADAIIEENRILRDYVGWERIRALDRRRQAVIVAVIGEGVPVDDFGEFIDTNDLEVPGNGIDDDANGLVDDFRGFSFVSGTGASLDSLSHHETHVSSLILTLADFNRGHDHPVRILPLQIASGRYDESYFEHMARAIEYAVSRGAGVINISAGSSAHYPRSRASRARLQSAADFAEAHGVLVLAAVSNDPGRNHDREPQIPAHLEQVVSVANHDHRQRLQSGYGRNVDLSFLGTGLIGWDPDRGVHAIAKGTSYATPLVAASVALYRAAHPELGLEAIRQDLVRAVVQVRSLRRIGSRGAFSPERFLRLGAKRALR